MYDINIEENAWNRDASSVEITDMTNIVKNIVMKMIEFNLLNPENRETVNKKTTIEVDPLYGKRRLLNAKLTWFLMHGEG